MPTIQQNSSESQVSVDDGILSAESGLIIYRISTGICTRPNVPYLKGVNHKTHEVLIFRPDCGCWDCPHCAEILVRKHRFRAVHGLQVLSEGGASSDFVTITSHEKLDHQKSLDVLPKAWKKLRERMNYSAGKSEYLLIPEFHKKGRVHFHMLTTAQLPGRWWKNNARECGFGFMSDAQEVKALGGVANYVSKYLTKMLQSPNLPEHFRRVRTSHGFPKLPDMPPNPDWDFSIIPPKDGLQNVVDWALSIGYTPILSNGTDAWDFVEVPKSGEILPE
jgi:hypothetical protein